MQKDEKILIEMIGTDCSDLACELIKQAKRIAAIPVFNIIDYKVLKEVLLNCNEEQIKEYAKYDLARMKNVDAYIGIRAADPKELYGISKESMEIGQIFIGILYVFKLQNLVEERYILMRY